MARPLAPRGQGRARVLRAALELFAEHGVSGTSLQMIAAHLGVTKAAVYHQFHAKEDIVWSVIEPALEEMRGFVTAAESAESADRAADIALQGVVDLIMGHRQVVAALYRDPEVERLVQSHQEFQPLTERLGRLLLGPDPEPRRRVATSVLGAGLARSGVDPQLDDIDDATLRAELLAIGRTLLGAAGQPPTGRRPRSEAKSGKTAAAGRRG